MNAMVPVTAGGKLSARFAGVPVVNELSAGIQQGFGLIGYKGKVWSIRYRGDTKTLMREDGDGPRNSIEVVILKSATVVSKIFYAGGYVEGSTEAPTCFSTNGLAPDPSATQKQCSTCAACPQNKWGSRKTAAGKDGKACSDSKRLAVAPLADIANEAFGGPMLLRVPAASLGDLAAFGEKMASWGYPYYSFGTRISFDPGESYPKFVFKEIGERQLTDAEADKVMQLRDSPAVARILAEGSEHVTPEVTSAPGPAFEAPKPVAVTPSAASHSAGAPPAVAVSVVDAPAPVEASAPRDGAPSFEDDLDAQLDKLMPSL